MTDQKDYRLYLDERFNALNTLMNAHFINVKDTLDSIKEQTTRTNGRVTEVEKDLDNFKELANKAIADGKHVIDTRVTECPNIKRFEKVEKKMEDLKIQLEDAMFFVRHPKMFIGIIVFFVLASIYTIYESGHLRGLINETKKEVQITNDEIIGARTRGQHYIPPDLRKDSIK